ncbi:hypothetical protein [Luteimonas qiangzhengi]|uniref:hypothetical protein n=1 Tax=Luteimonas sp. MJ146 TaxID=3129240 RepID=UPI0031BAF438
MTEQSPLPTTAILREARQLAALTSIIQDEFGDSTIESRESELVGLANDLAASIHERFQKGPTDGTAGAAYGASGKAAAVISSIVHAIACAALATDEDERFALANRIGWLQLSAGELAEKLASLVEQLCAEGAAA